MKRPTVPATTATYIRPPAFKYPYIYPGESSEYYILSLHYGDWAYSARSIVAICTDLWYFSLPNQMWETYVHDIITMGNILKHVFTPVALLSLTVCEGNTTLCRRHYCLLPWLNSLSKPKYALSLQNEQLYLLRPTVTLAAEAKRIIEMPLWISASSAASLCLPASSYVLMSSAELHLNYRYRWGFDKPLFHFHHHISGRISDTLGAAVPAWYGWCRLYICAYWAASLTER